MWYFFVNIFYVRREKGLGMANIAGVDECLGVIMDDISLLTSSATSLGLRLISHKIQLRVENTRE